MSTTNDGFQFTVPVSADAWAYAQRRLTYLEAVLVQILNDRGRIQEWYDARELAELRLPGLPGSKAGITRVAGSRNWNRREVSGKGGTRYQYHYASFPARAFDALIARILNVDPPSEDAPPVPDIPVPEPELKDTNGNTAPPWVLPFMRLLKGEAHGDLSIAWTALPDCVPSGVDIPTQEEAATIIMDWGLAH